MQPIEVVPYDPSWPKLFEAEADKISQALGKNCVVIYHVGSTAVPGLMAKPFIDIITVVKDLEYVIKPIENLGYQYKGEINIPFRKYFSKKDEVGRVHLHVYEEGNPEIELNLRFRDYLRSSEKARSEYNKLKIDLLNQEKSHSKNNSRFSGYTLGKDKFIKNILNKSGFDGLCMRFCTHYDEWEVARNFKEKHQLVIELNNDSKDHLHFVFYKGTEIVGYAYVQLLPDHKVDISTEINDRYKEHFLKQLNRWIEQHGN